MQIAVIAVFAPNLANAPAELQDICNLFSAAGHRVHQVAGADATLVGLQHALDAGPFDLVWYIGHAGPAGFALADKQTLSPVQFGQWLGMACAWQVVLNACFSAGHVAALQRAANVDAVATVDPVGVDDQEAWSTGAYLARALVATGDLAEACRRATGNGVAQYRFFPAGNMAARNQPDNSDEMVEQLVRALRGDPFTGTAGLIAQLTQLSTDLRGYMASNEVWKQEADRRLARLEERRPATITPLALLLTIIIVLATATALSLMLSRLGGAG